MLELQEETNISYSKYFFIGIIGLLFGGVIPLVGLLLFRVFFDNPNLVAQYLDSTNPDNIPQLLNLYALFATTIANILVLFGLGYVLRKVLVSDLLKFKSKLLRNIIIIVVGSILMRVLAEGVVYIYIEFLGMDPNSSSLNQELIETAIASPLAWAVFIATVLVAPLLEELIFRKCLFGMLEKNKNFSKITIIIISTLLFSFVHVSDLGSLQYIFLYVPYALVLSAAYSYSDNNYYVPLVMHLINNLFGFFGI